MKKIIFVMQVILLTSGIHSQTFTGATGAIPYSICNGFPVTVSGLGINQHIKSITFNITHPNDADLLILLQDPSGHQITLSSYNGGTDDNYTNTTFSVDASIPISSAAAPFTGTYLPEGNFETFDYGNPNGTWRLRPCDTNSPFFGTLNSWSITFYSSVDFPDNANLLTSSVAIPQATNTTVYGQVYKDGITNASTDPVQGIHAWLGYSSTNTDPRGWTNWVPAVFNQNAGPNDEYKATFGSNLPQGTYFYAMRYKINGSFYAYGAANNGFWDGITHNNGVLTVTAPVIPPNNNCSGAIPLMVNSDYACGSFTAGTVLMATASLVDGNACYGSEDDDVWFSFVASSATHRISLLNVSGSAIDLAHSLWTGADCDNLSLVPGSCSDANISNTTGLTIGQTYYLRVNTVMPVAMQTTVFNVCIGSAPTPPNQVMLTFPPTAAIAPAESVNVFGRIYKAGTTNVGFGQTPGIQAWVGLSPDNTDSNPATWVNWVNATFVQEVGNSDEYKAAIGSTLEPGNYYYATRFQFTDDSNFFYGGIDSSSNNGGFWDGITYKSGVLTVTGVSAPINDECAGARTLIVGNAFIDHAVVGTTYGATDSAPVTFNCDGIPKQVNSNVYYKMIVPANGALGIETKAAATNSLNDTVIVASVGNCSSLIGMSCSDNTNTGSFSKIVLFGQVPGSTVYVTVYKNGTEAPSVMESQFQISAYYNSSLVTESSEFSLFSSFPNPVKDFLNLSNDVAISKVNVFNLLGQNIRSITVDAKESKIDMSDFSNGIYLVSVICGDQTKILKVVKE